MRRAIEIGAEANPIVVDDIRDVHRTLLRFSADRRIAGVIREQQNWIGGNDFNPLGAAYVPPPPEHVQPLLEDFCDFLARDDLAPIAQAAIAHAQFENVHPFADGNGRVGRALIHTILRRRGEAINYIPPISLVLAAEQRDYIAGLATTGPATSAAGARSSPMPPDGLRTRRKASRRKSKNSNLHGWSGWAARAETHPHDRW